MRAPIRYMDRELCHMFVWFERNGQHVRVEVLESTPKNYELRFIDADGPERVETFTDSGALTLRQERLQRRTYPSARAATAVASQARLDGSARLGDLDAAVP